MRNVASSLFQTCLNTCGEPIQIALLVCSNSRKATLIPTKLEMRDFTEACNFNEFL